MPPPKVLALVASCKECPNHSYYSGGSHRCTLVDQAILDLTTVAPFCPLSDYPARVIVEMERTILALRDPHRYGFGLTLLTHIATKLKLNLHANGLGLTISLPKGPREVYLGLDYVTGINPRPFEIAFTSGESKFRLTPDSSPPVLCEATDKEGKLWTEHNLA